ncbi:DUF4174 domain-containing protein [Loktanella sp. S4079]|uniref:DUF4174 domain-containing protein n=1 Tax=Loktanella sp. S4079 TaxID=579483 RepID=UPI0005F9BB0D|nr:DUF4174 domain-containing protein [Loktanella sp. S4079]KJZ19736.1 hypothetical protein TW80_02220 [Loktanella sp. S4079]
MKLLTRIGLAILVAICGQLSAAQEQSVLERWETDRSQIFDAAEVNLADLQWLARPLIVFADSPNDPRFRQQLDLIADGLEDLAERDVILITDTSPDARSAVRTTLRPRGYSMVLLGKDGRVALRKPSPWMVREISRSIDKMPLRQQEIEDRRLLAQ